ncbi:MULTISPECIES: ABC transporter substrate-binding protein [unclassified Thermotoga]|uniref:ABC transporter substrate-binding protein n=1 Tax=unclassified Thermotoga TaxID=2631113 RepID=UPI000280EA16|nr:MULTISPECIES: ABC transporter substrate-binding protein [unclassified Thermotoga]AIY86303.1 ABC-type nitrate/sulfonate/bicarbonate transport systems periplasmic components-like protein [Thermotoga sp. 2812B]EJX26239.1 ABC-type nitrate/sulfonate/bicarbonate transport systems periplasmic components-like protein [Thermotoga sp. EMP]
MKKVTIVVLLLTISILFGETLLNPFGPALIPVVPIMNGKIPTDVKIEIWKNPEEAVAKIVSKEVDFAVLPVTVGANLYGKGVRIKLVGVHEWKVFYLVASDDATFDGWESLRGQEVYTPHGRGQTVDVLMRYFLSKAGLTLDRDVKILYAPPQEIVALFKSGKVKYAALPEPFVSMCLDRGKVVLDFQKEWGKELGVPGRIPIAGLFVREGVDKETVEKVEKALIDSIRWMKENLDETVQLSSEKLGIPAKILKSSLERIEFEYVPVEKCREEVETFLKKLNELYPEGFEKIPDEGFYWK